ncbi:hypothetical protein [Halorubrum tebenquichense]|uniref:Uncharacterized protein n=1 Tax=Halorubrum tebenquichense DSM 14210 TaxID=1227485 RepID=M0DSG4_9EURY|nr:hypothetical protein [Halorubrum tebenquichense]ELZ37617.1 hypothetical protein C472_07794 [Halorubrum tebenquichense DSM 14210]
MNERITSVLLIAVVALGAMTGVAAADGHLEVAVEDADGEPTVTVTQNDTAVENATVVVSVVDAENESYAGAGEYQTDANGTVGLEAPEEDVTVDVTVASGNESASTTVDLEAPDGLELDVEDTGGEPVVTVTDDDAAVENATVNVSVVDAENESYAGADEYGTDANGTVTLPAAEEDVTVDVTAEFDDRNVSATVDIEAPDGLELDVADTGGEPVVTVSDGDGPVENATVVVDLADDAGENASYAGTGEYETDSNGTVALPAAEGNVTVDVTASDDERTVSTTVELTTGEGDALEGTPFGQLMRDFIENISDRDGGIGGAVSDFATENNPGNAPDHAGNGSDDDGNASDAPGNAPEGVGNGSDDGERGPPDHAGPNGDDAEDDEAEADDTEEADGAEDDAEEDDAEDDDDDDAEEDDDDDEDDEDGERGPPDHAGGPGGN